MSLTTPSINIDTSVDSVHRPLPTRKNTYDSSNSNSTLDAEVPAAWQWVSERPQTQGSQDSFVVAVDLDSQRITLESKKEAEKGTPGDPLQQTMLTSRQKVRIIRR